jgi:DNA-binding response OmpR family regulator
MERPSLPDRHIRSGPLEIRPDEYVALVEGRALPLTLRELQLLSILASHPQQVMTRQRLYREMWGESPSEHDRRVDVHVSRLRSKLRQAMPDREVIHTHAGIGYRFVDEG